LPAGHLCPECKKGKIYPTGKAERGSGVESPIVKGQEESAWDEFQCDNCGHIIRELIQREKGKGADNWK
jgi:hypothetical protein